MIEDRIAGHTRALVSTEETENYFHFTVDFLKNHCNIEFKPRELVEKEIKR